MKGIEMNKNNFITWSYKWVKSTNNLPDGFCNLFWYVILAWVLMLLTLPVFLFTMLSKDIRKDPADFGFGVVFGLCLLLLCALAIGKELWVHTRSELLRGVLFFIVIIIGSVVLAGIGMGVGRVVLWVKNRIHEIILNRMSTEERIQYYKDDMNKKKKEKVKKKSFIRIGLESFIGKHCPKVNWK